MFLGPDDDLQNIVRWLSIMNQKVHCWRKMAWWIDLNKESTLTHMTRVHVQSEMKVDIDRC